jgi:hypothetical protein
MIRKPLLLTALASLALSGAVQAGTLDAPLTPEEQALADKGYTIEFYDPSQPSGHAIVQIRPSGKKTAPLTSMLAFTFGLEDAQPAREEGMSMASANYSPQMAEKFLYNAGWDKYHDRFFTRAYVQEGMDAFSKARHQRK